MYPRTLSARTLRRLDAFLVVWAAVWIAVAAYTANEVQVLRDLSGTMVATGAAVDTVGKALQGISSLPLIGGQVSTLANQVRAAGESAAQSGAATRNSVDNLSALLGISIGLIPIVPALVLYVPLRLGWRREQRAVVDAVRRYGTDASLEEYLARRALNNLPYHEIREISEDPWHGLAAPDRRRLAETELERLGLDVRLPPPSTPTSRFRTASGGNRSV